jgi:hypothetical protein
VPGSGSLGGVIRATHVDDLRRWFNTSETGASNYQFPQVRPLIFGINPSWAEWQCSPTYTNAQMMAAIKAAGATAIRSGIDWNAIEPIAPVSGVHTYYWNAKSAPGAPTTALDYDANVQLTLDNGLLWIADVGTAPNWATGNSSGQMPPTSAHTADFQAFVTAVANHYLGQIRHYEFVNEPNGFGWVYPSGTTNTAKGQIYESWLQLFYAAIKGVDSTAWVSTGGIDNLQTGNGLDFISGIYSVSGATSYFDAISGHPYAPNNGAMDTTGIQNLRNLMVSDGDTFKPIWITEYGWDVNSNSDSITLTTQQQYLQSALNFFAASSDNYVMVATFQLIADIYGPSGNIVFGLLDQHLDATVRQDPSYGTFSSYAKPTT